MDESVPTEPAAPAEPAAGGTAGRDIGKKARRALDYGWMPLLALAATQFLESGDRQALSQAIDGIQGEFGVSDFWIGVLPSAAVIFGMMGSIPIGILADRVRRTWLLAGAMLIWTLSMGLSGLATAYWFLFAMRMLLGAVEANSPAAVSLITDYYPVQKRAKMMGLYQAGALFGGILGLVGGGIAVDQGSWRWAFFMWIPLGLAVVLWLYRTREPIRGDQDRDFEADLTAAASVEGLTGVEGVGAVDLPPPSREGTIEDYDNVSNREALREFRHVKSMWFAVIGLGTSQMLLTALSFWGVEYFKRVHELDATGAGILTGSLGLSSVIGIVGGGFLADRLFSRGLISARVWVAGISSILAGIVFVPAFASTNLWVTAPLMMLGGIFMTLPVAPAEAMLNDVIMPQLRGRASTVRTVVRSVGNLGPVIVGGISTLLAAFPEDPEGLQFAIVYFSPVYIIGGIVVLFGAKYYPGELAFVIAETRRQAESREPDERDTTD